MYTLGKTILNSNCTLQKHFDSEGEEEEKKKNFLDYHRQINTVGH